MLEQLRAKFPQLTSGDVSNIYVLSAIAAVVLLLFLFSGKNKDGTKRDIRKNPLWALIVLFLGACVFGGFLYGGIEIGKLFGFQMMGAFIGIFAYLFLAALLKYLMTPKDQRRKRFM